MRCRSPTTLRGWFSVSADAEDCDCPTAFYASCDVAGLTGAEVGATANGCEPDVNWPMSGVAWALDQHFVPYDVHPIHPEHPLQ